MVRGTPPASGANAPRLAALALTPRVRRVLEGALRQTLDTLHPMLDAVLSAADDGLFRRADAARSNREQQQLMDARRALAQRRGDAHERFATALEGELAAWYGAPPIGTARDGTPLSLLAVEEHEESVDYARAGARVDTANREALVALALRLAALGARRPAPSDELPLAPQSVARAARAAFAGFDDTIRGALIEALDDALLQRLAPLYAALNTEFAAQGVLPHLRRGALLGALPGGPPGESAPKPAEVAARPPAEAPASDYDALRAALARRRAAGEAAEAATPASAEDLAAILDALQMQPQRTSGPDAPGAAPLRERLAAALAEAGVGALGREQADAADLVDLLFRGIGQELPASGLAGQILGRLRLPMFRLLLQDEGALVRPAHPARRLLGTLLEIGAYWQDVDAESRGLLEQAQVAIDRVEGETGIESGLLETIEHELGRRLRALQRKAELAERRHVEAAAGRERLELARRRAEGAVHRTLGRRNPPQLARALLENAWTDVLALTLLRYGELSEAWKRRLEVAEFLAARAKDAAPDEDEAEPVKQEVESGLSQVGFQPDEIQALVGRIFGDVGEAANDADEGLERAAARVRSRFADQRRGERGANAVELAVESTIGALDEREQKALEELRALRPGTWLRFRQGHQGEFVERKLAWISRELDRGLLVNRRGAKVEERALESLARDVVRGTVVVLGSDPEPPMERAWKRFLATLGGDAESGA